MSGLAEWALDFAVSYLGPGSAIEDQAAMAALLEEALEPREADERRRALEEAVNAVKAVIDVHLQHANKRAEQARRDREGLDWVRYADGRVAAFADAYDDAVHAIRALRDRGPDK